MPRKCAICSDERRNLIDEKLVRNVANSHIGLEYGFSERQVGQHKKNHVTPFVASANALAQQAIVDKIIEFRTEVNYPTLTKILAMQDRLLNELELADESDKRIAIIKEYRGWNIELAKVQGEYTADKQNPADLKSVAKIVADFRERIKRDADIYAETNGKYGYAMPDDGFVESEIEKLCRLHKVKPEQLATLELGGIGWLFSPYPLTFW